MYGNWLKPAPKPDDSFPDYCLGRRLQRDPRTCSIGIIGFDGAIADRTRQYLYAAAWDFDQLSVADLGNLRKVTTEFAIPLLRELHTSNITPILLGGSQGLFASQYLALNEVNRQVSVLNIDSQVELTADDDRGMSLDRLVHRKQGKEFHLTHIGSQQHLVDPALWRVFDARNYEYIRLGIAREAVSEMEPQVRDADVLGYNIRALNHHDAPARNTIQPSGFDLQEACQLTYYAGNSDKLSSFGLYGLDLKDPNELNVELTAATYAQLIWYFLQGYSRRMGDFPVSTDEMQEYVVDMDGATRLTFYRSPKTERWWCAVPQNSEEPAEERHSLVACSYQDYLTASQEQLLPDRLLCAFRRFA